MWDWLVFQIGAKGSIIYDCIDAVWSPIYCLCREMNMLLKNRKHYKSRLPIGTGSVVKKLWENKYRRNLQSM